MDEYRRRAKLKRLELCIMRCVIRIFSGRRKLHEQVEDNFVLLYEDNSSCCMNLLYVNVVLKEFLMNSRKAV